MKNSVQSVPSHFCRLSFLDMAALPRPLITNLRLLHQWRQCANKLILSWQWCMIF